MRKILYLLATLLMSTIVWANMMDFTGGYGVAHKSGKGCIIGLLTFVVGAFIFSVIFWLTHKWLVKKKR